MAELGQHGFDSTQVEPSTDFDILPADKYISEISDSDMRPNSKGTGEYLWLEFTILDGPFAGRKIWTQLNLDNPSSQAVEIAQRELSAICHAVGKLHIQDSIELHNIPLEINVKIKNSPEYGQQNLIRGYKAVGGKTTSPKASANKKNKSTEAEPSTEKQNSSGSSLPPWKRK